MLHTWSGAGIRAEEPIRAVPGVRSEFGRIARELWGSTSDDDLIGLRALARALQLTGAERDHLYRLAGLAPPRDGTIVDHIPPACNGWLTRLGDTPVCVFAADWSQVWCNRGWAALFGHVGGALREGHSLVRIRFPTGAGRERIAEGPVILGDRGGHPR